MHTRTTESSGGEAASISLLLHVPMTLHCLLCVCCLLCVHCLLCVCCLLCTRLQRRHTSSLPFDLLLEPRLPPIFHVCIHTAVFPTPHMAG